MVYFRTFVGSYDAFKCDPAKRTKGTMETVTVRQNSIVVSRLSEAREISSLLALFDQVAAEAGWQSNGELEAYSTRSWHIAATMDGQLAGGIQIACRSASKCLPYHDVWPEVEVAAIDAVEVTVLAVNKQYHRNTRVFWGLCVELWRLLLEEGVSQFVLEATPEMFARYRKLGWPLEIIGELREHMGEPCYLCKLDTNSVAGSLVAMSLHYPSFRSVLTDLTKPLTGRCREAVAVA